MEVILPSPGIKQYTDRFQRVVSFVQPFLPGEEPLAVLSHCKSLRVTQCHMGHSCMRQFDSSSLLLFLTDQFLLGRDYPQQETCESEIETNSTFSICILFLQCSESWYFNCSQQVCILHPCYNAICISQLNCTVIQLTYFLYHHTICMPRFRESGSQWLCKSHKCNEISFKRLSQELHILKDLFHYEFKFKLNLHAIKSP